MKKILMMVLLISSVAILIVAAAAVMTQKKRPVGETDGNTVTDQIPYLTPEVISAEQVQKRVKKELELDKVNTVYDMEYQNAAGKQVEKWKAKKSYTPEEPLLILNPFGTNVTGLYIYFENGTRVNVEYEVSVKDEDICSFSGTLFTNTAGMPLANQEGQIIGLIQGKTNYIVLYLYDKDGSQIGKIGYKVEVPDYGTVKEPKLKYEMSRNSNQLAPGLFCLFGYDRRREEEPRHLLFYDNEGNIRAEIPVAGSVADVNLQRVDGNLFYACGARKYAQVNHLGRVEKIYSLGKKYLSHHD